jgi:hypothetical protein
VTADPAGRELFQPMSVAVGRSVCQICGEKEPEKRGIYIADTVIHNADAVGAYNILRKYHVISGREIDMPITGLSNTDIIKVAV